MKIIDKIGKYKTRDWHQRKPSEIRYITIHHSAIKSTNNQNDEETLKTIKKHHQAKGWPGLSFHYVITKNGKIYQINKHEDITWHDRVNRDSIGIVLDGYFHEPHNETPTKEQLKSLKNLLYKLRKDLAIHSKNVISHRERSSTDCPGDILNKYIQEYKKKGNAVSWGYIDEKMKQMEIILNPKERIPDEWSESLKLNQEEWFNNKWSFEKLLENVNQWYESTIMQTKVLENKDEEIKILKDTNNNLQKQVNALQNIIEENNKVIKNQKKELSELEEKISNKTPLIYLLKLLFQKIKRLFKSTGARSGI